MIWKRCSVASHGLTDAESRCPLLKATNTARCLPQLPNTSQETIVTGYDILRFYCMAPVTVEVPQQNGNPPTPPTPSCAPKISGAVEEPNGCLPVEPMSSSCAPGASGSLIEVDSLNTADDVGSPTLLCAIYAELCRMSGTGKTYYLPPRVLRANECLEGMKVLPR